MGVSMSLWYNTGTHWKEVSMARNDARMKGIMVGSGPSLDKIDLNALTGTGKRVFGMNNAYPAIKPDVWLGMDLPIYHDGRVFDEPFIKILRGSDGKELRDGRVISTIANVYYADVEEVDDSNELFLRRNHNTKFVWHGNTMATTLHVIVWMGHREIYIAGCDLDNSNRHHFQGHPVNHVTDEAILYDRQLYDQLFVYLEWFVRTAARNGIQVYSISPDSRINTIMHYVDLKDLNDEIQASQQERDYLPRSNTFVEE
jgi:hypothetical protein